MIISRRFAGAVFKHLDSTRILVPARFPCFFTISKLNGVENVIQSSTDHPKQPTDRLKWVNCQNRFAGKPTGIRESPGPPPKSSLPCVFFGQSQGCQRSAASRWPRKSNGWNSAVRKPLRKKQRPTSWTLLQYLCSWRTEPNFIITFLGNIIWDIRIILIKLTNPIKKGNFFTENPA